MSDSIRVAITGYGAICSLGEDSNQIWDSIKAKKIGYKKHAYKDDSIKTKYFGFMDSDKTRYKPFKKRILRALPEYAKYALCASNEAFKMAFGDKEPIEHYNPFDIAVIAGTGWGGVDAVNDNNNEYTETGFSTSYATLMSMNNAATAGISMSFKLRGYQNTVIAACATGAIAIGDGFELIKSGRAKCVIAGGAESIKEVFNVWSIDVLEALTKEQDDLDKACCPFDRNRSGFVLSEGAAFLCLEDYDEAVKRKANILAEVKGYANFSDAHDYTAPAPDMGARVQCINKALQQANLQAQDIDYINLHGTSTPLNDLNESESIKAALGDYAFNIPMSSTKSYTGHLIGAAGSLESIFAIKAMREKLVPATAHLQNPDPKCDLNYTPIDHQSDVDMNNVLSLSFGFGGSNAALVFSKGC